MGRNTVNAQITIRGWLVEETGLSAESRGDSVVITIHGDLDITSSPRLDETLTNAELKHHRVILDLADVDFLDTSALAVIVGHWKKLERSGGMLALAGARYRYTKTLWITGLADKLTLYETVAEALAAQARAAGPKVT
jgi:stage II sporulation protein AA (anti-sigma F factor antagonist)